MTTTVTRAPIPDADAIAEGGHLIAWLRLNATPTDVCDRLEQVVNDLVDTVDRLEADCETESAKVAAVRVTLEGMVAELGDDHDDEALSERLPAPCEDCGVDTVAGYYDHEWYIVHEQVWIAALKNPHEDRNRQMYLCVGCLEKRLGRDLTAADFTDAPINSLTALDSPRLADRKRRHPASDPDAATPQGSTPPR